MDIPPIHKLQRSYRHAQRFHQILGVLIRYGFVEFVEALHIDQYIDFKSKMISEDGKITASLTRMERMRRAIEELGPTFIKIGQILSTRADRLPIEVIEELQKLQDQVPPFPFVEVRRIIEEDFHRPITEVFAHFEEPPVAAASIGQVHRAILSSGEVVAVKVRRPNVETTIAVDLEILHYMAELAEKHVEGFDVQRPAEIVREMQSTLRQEIDYTREAAHMARFAAEYADDPTTHVPHVYRALCTERILVQEWIEGIKVFDVEYLREKGYDLKVIAHRGAHLILQQIFIHGFFHADPHPGNIFILPDNVVCFIDFGMVGRLPRQSRDNLIDLVTAVVNRDERAAVDALLELTIWTDEPTRRDLEADISDFIQMHCAGPLKTMNLGRILREIMEQAQKHRLRIPPNIYLVLKSLSTVEGIGRALDPDFDVIAESAPVAQAIQEARLQPKAIAKGLFRSAKDFTRLIKSLPMDLRAVIKQLKVGKLKIEFEHMGLESMEQTLDRITNRIAFAIVLAALIIGSSVIIHSGIPPRYHDVPIIGLLGYVLSALMAVRLLISIWRSGKL